MQLRYFNMLLLFIKHLNQFKIIVAEFLFNIIFTLNLIFSLKFIYCNIHKDLLKYNGTLYTNIFFSKIPNFYSQ